jgi:hypothetical protein
MDDETPGDRRLERLRELMVEALVNLESVQEVLSVTRRQLQSGFDALDDDDRYENQLVASAA